MASQPASDPSLSLYRLLDPAVLADPYPLYARLRKEDPVHWDPFLHSWVVTRYADVLTVLQRFSADRTPSPEQMRALGLGEIEPIAAVMVKQMLFLDAPAHTHLRKLCSSAFTPRRVELLEDRIETIAHELIDRVVASGSMDVVGDFAAPFPAIVTAHLLGVPADDHLQLKAWSADFAEMLGNFQHNPERVGQVLKSVADMTAYFRSAIREEARVLPDGLIRSLVEAEVDGARLTEDEVIANVIVTMVGGQETTTNLIGNGLLTLLRQPDRLAELRDRPEIAPTAIEELLRFEAPSQHTATHLPRGHADRRRADPQGRGGDGGDGGGQSRSRSLRRSRSARSRAAGQSPSRLRLGGAFLLRRAARADGGADRVRDVARAAARPRARRRQARMAAESRVARAHRAARALRCAWLR